MTIENSNNEMAHSASNEPTIALKALPIGHGWLWIKQGYGLFKQDIGIWIGMIVAYFAIMMVLSFIPLLGIVTVFLGPLFTAGFMVAAHHAFTGEKTNFEDLFAGFKNQTSPLFLLSLIYIGCYLAIMILMVVLVMLFGGGEMISAYSTNDFENINSEFFNIGMLLALLITVAVAIPVAMAIYFAPALVFFHKMGPWAAFKLSFSGCLKNVMPFLWYGIILIPLGFVATIPFALGWLFLAPILVCSIYAGYRDIFLETN